MAMRDKVTISLSLDTELRVRSFIALISRRHIAWPEITRHIFSVVFTFDPDININGVAWA